MPAIGAVVATAGSYSANSWIEVDVTTAVTGNGEVSFAITTLSNSGSRFNSKEGLNAPELVITTVEASNNTPTAANDTATTDENTAYG